MQRIRIKDRVFFEGRVREPGEEISLPDGVKGPHRAVSHAEDRIDYGTNPPIDANRRIGDIEDVPLYDVLDPPAVKPDEQMKDDLAKALAPRPSSALGTLEGLVGLLANPEATKRALADLKQKQDELTALQDKIAAAGKAHAAKEAELNARGKQLTEQANMLSEESHGNIAKHEELSTRAAAIDKKTLDYEANAKRRDAEHVKLRQTFADETTATAKKLADREFKMTQREHVAETKHDELSRREAAITLREHNVQQRIDELSQHLRPL